MCIRDRCIKVLKGNKNADKSSDMTRSVFHAIRVKKKKTVSRKSVYLTVPQFSALYLVFFSCFFVLCSSSMIFCHYIFGVLSCFDSIPTCFLSLWYFYKFILCCLCARARAYVCLYM